MNFNLEQPAQPMDAVPRKGHGRFFLHGLALFLIGFGACHVIAGEETVRRMRPLLGTYTEIIVKASDRARADAAIAEAFDAIQEVDRLLSSHRSDSELNAINADAGRRAITVSPWTWECVTAAMEVGRRSHGAFDITCRPLLDLWGFVTRRYRFPDPAEIRAALPLVGWEKVILLPETRTRPGDPLPPRGRVGLAQEGMTLDVGGIGKGFAADKAVEALRRNGMRAGLVRLGGDLRGFGPCDWTIGVANPADPRQAIRTFTIRNEAVSTSGNYQNGFLHHGHRYSHILDPRTGWPVASRRSLTVRAPLGILADAWSTALFVDPSLVPPPGVRIVDQR